MPFGKRKPPRKKSPRQRPSRPPCRSQRPSVKKNLNLTRSIGVKAGHPCRAAAVRSTLAPVALKPRLKIQFNDKIQASDFSARFCPPCDILRLEGSTHHRISAVVLPVRVLLIRSCNQRGGASCGSSSCSSSSQLPDLARRDTPTVPLWSASVRRTQPPKARLSSKSTAKMCTFAPETAAVTINGRAVGGGSTSLAFKPTAWAVPTERDDAIWAAMTREQQLVALQNHFAATQCTTPSHRTIAEIVARARAHGTPA